MVIRKTPKDFAEGIVRLTPPGTCPPKSAKFTERWFEWGVIE